MFGRVSRLYWLYARACKLVKKRLALGHEMLLGFRPLTSANELDETAQLGTQHLAAHCGCRSE